MKRPESPSGHWLYKCYDAEGDCLYVGATLNPYMRAREHRRNSAWYPLVAKVGYRRFKDILGDRSALVAEREAIRVLRPRYNKIRRNGKWVWAREGIALERARETVQSIARALGVPVEELVKE